MFAKHGMGMSLGKAKRDASLKTEKGVEHDIGRSEYFCVLGC